MGNRLCTCKGNCWGRANKLGPVVCRRSEEGVQMIRDFAHEPILEVPDGDDIERRFNAIEKRLERLERAVRQESDK